MKITLENKKITLTTEYGITVNGEYYFKNNEMYLKAKTGYDLTILMKYKNKIKEMI